MSSVSFGGGSPEIVTTPSMTPVGPEDGGRCSGFSAVSTFDAGTGIPDAGGPESTRTTADPPSGRRHPRGKGDASAAALGAVDRPLHAPTRVAKMTTEVAVSPGLERMKANIARTRPTPYPCTGAWTARSRDEPGKIPSARTKNAHARRANAT